MKHLLLTTIAALVMVGCGESSIHDAAIDGNIEAVKQYLDGGADVNASGDGGDTPLDIAIMANQTEIADLLRKHGGKTGEELEAEGK